MNDFRPLSSLYFVATVCAVTAVLAAGHTIAWQGLLTGVLSVVSIGAVVGRAHPLARAGAFLATLSAACVAEAHASGIPLAESVAVPRLWMFAVCVLLATAATRLAVRWVRSRVAGDVPNEVVRFSLMDFFGWTTVVALACFLLQQTASQEFLEAETYRVLLPLLGIAWAGVWLLGVKSAEQFALYGALFLVASLACVTVASQQFADTAFGPIMLIQSLVLLTWGWVRFLDEQAAVGRPRGG